VTGVRGGVGSMLNPDWDRVRFHQCRRRLSLGLQRNTSAQHPHFLAMGAGGFESVLSLRWGAALQPLKGGGLEPSVGGRPTSSSPTEVTLAWHNKLTFDRLEASEQRGWRLDLSSI